MKHISRHVWIFSIFLFISAFVGGWRLCWINKALPAKAKVQSIFKGFSSDGHTQYYPVVEYATPENSVWSTGTCNLPVEPGQVLNILYNPDDLQDWMIDDPYWLWFDILSWYHFLPLSIFLYYVLRFLVLKYDKRLAAKLAADREKTDFAEYELVDQGGG
ncbi:MAG: hypothetical protein EOP49_13415 [Sphingobacteriales bacterium]|nr:MAG: hypothetical protein EOP49_13415 [Sphingobacteriales bacterium]